MDSTVAGSSLSIRVDQATPLVSNLAINSSPVTDIIKGHSFNSSEVIFDRELLGSNDITVVPAITDSEYIIRSVSLNPNSAMRMIPAPVLLVLLSTLAQGQTPKHRAIPPRSFALSFPETPKVKPFIPSPKLATTPKYTTPKYQEFYGSTPAYDPFHSQSFKPIIKPIHKTLKAPIPPPVYLRRKPSCDPHNPPACSNNGTDYCLHDSYYPKYDVEAVLKVDHHLTKKYADVKDQSAEDLITHIQAKQEAHFDYSYYNPAASDITHWIGPEGYICPSKVIYSTLRRARNVKGEWRVIVNGVKYYTQTARIERCLYPLTPCRMMAPCFKSKCIQKFSYHRLLSYDPCDPHKGVFIDIYRLPSACSCYVPAILD